MCKRVTALLLAICLLITAAPVTAGAADTQAVSVGTSSVYTGNTTSVTVRAENFNNIASLEVYLYYDASALQVSSTSNGSLLSGAQTSVNTAEAGTIKLVTMSLEGISGSGTLLTVSFKASYSCDPGTYPITVAIGGAYDTSLADVTVGSANGSITVLERTQSEETFSIYANYNKSTLQKGDTFTFSVRNNSYSRSFVSADFILEYDQEVFEFESAGLASALQNEGAIYSVNSSVLGQVRITYASNQPVSTSSLFSVSLKVIADTNGTTQVKAKANNVYKEDLSAYLPGSCNYYFTLKKLPEAVDYPNAFLQTEALKVGQQSKSVFQLEAGAGVAAADFTLSYDPTVLRCVSVTAADTLAEQGGMVIINDNFSTGTIRFSYINMDAYGETEVPIVSILWEPLYSPMTHYQVTGSGVGVVDAQQEALTLEYVTDSGCIHQPTVTPPVCLEDGYTTFTCYGCDDSYKVDIVSKLGHDIAQYEAKKETCSEVGWNAYEACSRCEYTTYVEIPALGHDEIPHTAQVETCTGIGWADYVTCSRCDYTTYEEIPALGHRVIGQVQVQVEPVEIQNSSFTLTDGVYYSKNHTDSSSSSFQVTALYDCTVDLTYGVSSEANYDMLYILLNSSQLDVISGSVTNKTRSVTMSAGDILTIRYSKDGSAASGQDRGWVKLDYALVWTTGLGDVPAESGEPTCTEAVVCHYCQTVIKEALGHDAVPHEGKAPTCLEGGWAAYETCSRCDHTTYEALAALGHDVIPHTAQAETCTGVGWTSYETCSRCDYTTYVEIPALGHRVIGQVQVQVEPVEIQNSSFALTDGVYYSQNHSNSSSSSFQVTALYDCTVDLTYSVSSEASYDKLYILLNGSQLDVISGTITNRTRSVTMSAGDILTIRYSKDSSANVGQDRGWVKLEYEQVLDTVSGDVPAESAEPTCTEAVVCHYCQAVVKEALGHDDVPHEGKAPTCLEGGWADYVTCSRCDHTTYTELSALDHDLQLEEPKAPTCTEDGYEVSGGCTRCDYVVYVGLPALGHDAIPHEGKAPTCNGIGWESYVTCSRCDHTTYAELSALGHDEIAHDGQAPTCLNAGWEDYVTCSRCDYTTYKAISPLGHDEVPHEGKAATCTEGGWEDYVTCSRCDYTTYKAISALGHDEVSQEAKAATCTEVGWAAYAACSRCDYNTRKDIPALGHNCTEKIEDPAHLRSEAENCQQVNTYWYGCSRCDGISDTAYFAGTTPGAHIFTERLKDDAHWVPGTADPAWYYYDCAHCDTMGNARFSDTLPGDLDEDGDVDEDDVIYLLQHLLMPDDFAVDQSVDYDKNGNVDEDDVIYLLQHLLMPEDFPLV